VATIGYYQAPSAAVTTHRDGASTESEPGTECGYLVADKLPYGGLGEGWLSSLDHYPILSSVVDEALVYMPGDGHASGSYIEALGEYSSPGEGGGSEGDLGGTKGVLDIG
jgi:hypothetical protein